jgi:hypothetical protein
MWEKQEIHTGMDLLVGCFMINQLGDCRCKINSNTHVKQMCFEGENLFRIDQMTHFYDDDYEFSDSARAEDFLVR